MNLRKPCEHGKFDPHRFTDKMACAVLHTPENPCTHMYECLGGINPTNEELVEEVNQRRASAAPYDIEIPDFVNRHGTW